MKNHRKGRISRALIIVWTGSILLFLYMPMLSVVMASFTKQRYFQFPVKMWDTRWYEKAFTSLSVRDLFWTSISIATLVTLLSVVLAFFGALAFARYDWKGRKLYQRLILLPIFFPQAGAWIGFTVVVFFAWNYDKLADSGVRAHDLDTADCDIDHVHSGIQFRSSVGGGGIRSRRLAVAGAQGDHLADSLSRYHFRRHLRISAFLGKFPSIAFYNRS